MTDFVEINQFLDNQDAIITDISSKLQNLRDTVSTQVQKITYINSLETQIRQRLYTVSNENEFLMELSRDLNQQIAQTDSTITGLRGELESLQLRNRQYEMDIASLERHLDAKRQESEALKGNIETLLNQRGNLAQEIENVKTRISTNNAMSLQQQQYIQQLHTNISELDRTVEELGMRYMNLRKEAEEQDVRKQQLQNAMFQEVQQQEEYTRSLNAWMAKREDDLLKQQAINNVAIRK